MNEPVLVKLLDPNLIKSYGHYHHYELDKALRGQKEGKWIIVDKEEKEKSLYEDKEATSLKNQDYLTKTEFKKPRSGLGYKDLYGVNKK